MGSWVKKSGRKLRDAVMVIKRDRRWLVPFLQEAQRCHKRNAADLVRRALWKRVTDLPYDEYVGGTDYDAKQDWSKVQFRIAERTAWLSDALNAEAEKRGCSPSDVLFMFFCEEYGEELPELKEKYEKWRELNLVEAA